MSVITLERLRRFNDVQGTVAGNAVEELEARQQALTAPDMIEGEDFDGPAIHVEDGGDEDPEALAAEERDEVLSKAM